VYTPLNHIRLRVVVAMIQNGFAMAACTKLFQERWADRPRSVARDMVFANRTEGLPQSGRSAAHREHVEWRLHAADLDPWPLHRRSQELRRGREGGPSEQVVQRMYTKGRIVLVQMMSEPDRRFFGAFRRPASSCQDEPLVHSFCLMGISSSSRILEFYVDAEAWLPKRLEKNA